MISIAMATYNGEKYIKEQIDSILNQTIQDFELVVCDDCSSDSTIDILKEYSKRDERITAYENEKQLGFLKNFEKAVSLCKGEYIALSDQDDIWMPDHLELLHKAIKGKSMSCGNALLVDSNALSMGMTYWEQVAFESIPSSNLGKAMSILLFRNPFQGAAMMINRDLLKYALPIPEFVYFHDTWFAALACFCDGIACVKTPILKYRRVNESVTGSRKDKIPRYTQYRRHLIPNQKLKTIKAISERLQAVTTIKEKRFLKKMEKICIRNNTRKGKWVNFIYTTLHYRTIYNSSLTSWK